MRRATGLGVLLLALAGLAGCATREKTVKPSGEITAEQRQKILHRKVASLLEKKSYRRAIELMCGENQPGYPVAGMGREYVTAVNGLVATGEESLSRGECGAAGLSFRWALDAYPAEPSLREKVVRDPKQVRGMMDGCSNSLMEQGLLEYRRGNLESAIRKWKEIVAFDPGNKEAKKSIETATAQLRTLQNMEKSRQ